MHRLLIAAAVAGLVWPAAHSADPVKEPPKDTSTAHFTRTKKLKGKVTVDFKNEFLRECFKEISSQLEDQKLGALSVTNAAGVSLNTRVTLTVKDATAEDVIDQLLKQLELGYVVVSKDKDRYDGWLLVTKGPERGYPAGVGPKPDAKDAKKAGEPKKPDADKKGEDPKKADDKKTDEAKKPPSEEDEKAAAGKLDVAKKLLDEKKDDRAKTVLKYVVKHYPDTKAGIEAKELLAKADK